MSLGLAAIVPSSDRPEGPVLRKEISVHAPLTDVWRAWTTAEGLRFASRRSNVRLEVGGPYEWFLDGPADADGVRGSEGSRVLAFLPQEMLAFDWTFPPDTPTLRREGAKTQVVVLFEDLGGEGIRVRLAQHGWQEGEEWERGFAYFDEAWGYVLEGLKRTLELQAETDDGA
jgi:uncharacterized protein YndB with AHSA1/START domain